jgi:hypothetical protein
LAMVLLLSLVISFFNVRIACRIMQVAVLSPAKIL